MVGRTLICLAMVGSVAAAGPFKETLSKQQRRATVEAIQAALPPVDKAAAQKCTDQLAAYNKVPDADAGQLPAIAQCYRAAGSLGAAIALWRQAEMHVTKEPALADTIRALAAAYEAAGSFDDAARELERLSGMAGTLDLQLAHVEIKDARELRLRALCIRRQLGEEREAGADESQLKRGKAGSSFDAEASCATIRPIAMPAGAPAASRVPAAAQ